MENAAVAFNPDDAASEEQRRETQEDKTPDGNHPPIHVAHLADCRFVAVNTGLGPCRLVVPSESEDRADGYQCEDWKWVHTSCGL